MSNDEWFVTMPKLGETVPVGTQLVRIVPPGGVVREAPLENRLPSATHHLAAAGGPALGDPAAPQMGGSEGPSDEVTGLGAPAGLVHDITMPKLGETVTEGTISSWLKNAGDTVEFDDPLFEVSTDKVDSEIPSPYDGVLLEILVAAGETVPVGTPLARIGEAGTTAPGTAASTPALAAAAAAGSANGAGNGSPNGSAAAPRTAGVMLSPLVRRLAAENS